MQLGLKFIILEYTDAVVIPAYSIWWLIEKEKNIVGATFQILVYNPMQKPKLLLKSLSYTKFCITFLVVYMLYLN